MREPWARDQHVYQDGMSGHGATQAERSLRAGLTRQKAPPSQEQLEKEYREDYQKWLKRTGWNSTPFRNAPEQLKGLSPVTREPWFEDMAVYNSKFSNHAVDEKERYADGTVGAKKLSHRPTAEEAAWDSSTWKYVPHTLKGIKPVTNEPWARDEAVYNESRNSVDTRDAGADGLSMDVFSFAGSVNKKELSQVDLSRESDNTWDASAKPPDGAMRAYPA